MAPPIDARRVSLGILQSVLYERRPLDDAFRDHPRLSDLSRRDRSFVRLLTTSVIRRLGEIDAVLASFLEKPLRQKRQAGQDVLRLGAAQLLVLDTPAHAAVATSVALVKAIGLGGLAGLVNAVLRRVARDGKALMERLDADRLSLPDWLWERLLQVYGERETRAVARVQRNDPPLDLSLRDPDQADHWAEQLEADILANRSLRLAPGTGDIKRLAGYGKGAWWVQDVAASLPVQLLAPQPGETVADLCAAPGGKTLQLAAAGAEVFALDLQARRMALVQKNLMRTGLSASCAVADATAWQAPRPLDAVLLDAPCSATGTLRRHPDIALQRRLEALPALTELQDRLLDSAAALLRPGGRLVYSVCSLLPEEGAERVHALLDRGAPLRIEAASPDDLALPQEAADGEGALLTRPSFWSDIGGMDGFYICRLRRL